MPKTQRNNTHRETVERSARASCENCNATWSGNNSIAAATFHARDTGHVVTATYAATYRYSIGTAQ